MTKQILLSLLNCSWQWGLLGGLTWLITRRFRRANSTSHLLWLLFLLSLPILFALNQFVPALSINGTVPELTEAQPVHISGLAAQTADLPAIASTESGTQSQGHTVAGSQFFLNWTATNLILCIWAIGTLAMLTRLAFGLFRIRRLRRTATVADDSYQAICKRLAQQLNIIRPITVCFSDRIVSPISFGWLSPSILIPRKLNLEQFELVAAHELAHVQRLDWLINLFSQVVGAIFFFHPIYHFLNRKLVHLRERICDDWVIQLTGARKNYAQCLLDLVRHENRAILLALALGRPSQLESRIDSILKHNRRLDLKPKPRLLMLATFLLLTCLPLLSMAQLMPLRTVQLSLFAQTPQESEEAADDVDKKSDEQKKTAEMKDKKVYKEDNSVKVLDPEGFIKSQENRLFSGPQTGEKLPPLKVTGITGEFAGKPLDIIAETGRKPLVLFLQDTNAVGVKGLVGASKLLLTIDAFQKKHSNVNIAEKSDQGFQIGVVFLADNLDALPEWAHNMIQKGIPNEVLIGISPDGREGPGSYGLNRNVAQTILVAKDGKVLHNFAFTQPMLYTDPHLLGAIAQVMEIEPATLEKWLNEEAMKKYKEDKLDEKSIAAKFAEIQKAIRNGKISREKAAEWLEKLGITWEEGEQLLNKTKDGAQMMDRKRQYENRRQVEVADPTRFNTSEENKVFSGPQPGEKLPSLKATGIRGGAKDVTFDFIAKADGRPHVLLLQDESGVGLRGLYDVVGVVNKISKKSDKDLHISVVFLSDDPAALKQITQHVPENVLVGISLEGREGPGNYGLNRNVAQTIIIAKDGKVLHNFAFTQPLLYADPHVIGAIAQTIGEDPSAVEKWLNEAPAEDKQMQRDRGQTEDKSNRTEELRKQLNTLRERLQSSKESVSAAMTKGKKDRFDHLEELLKQPSSAVSKTTNDPTVVSPFGFGPYPKIPDSWPQGFKYWPCENERLELMQRVEIKLTEQGKNVVGSTMSKGLVYPNLEGIVYVRWSESTNGEKYISRITGYPPDAQRLTELVETLEDQNIPFTEADVPNDIKLVNYDEAGIEPYQFLGKDFSPYGLGLYPPLPDKWKNLEIWPCDSLESELKWRVHIKLISQGKDPLRCMTRDGMVFPLYPDTVYIKWKKLEPDGGHAYNMLAKKEPGDRVRAIIKEKVNKVRTNRTNDFSITKDDFPDDLNVLSFEEGGIDPYIFLNLQKPEEVNP